MTPHQHRADDDVVWSDEVGLLGSAADVEASLDAQMAEWLTAEPVQRAADIGCGTGGMAVALATRAPDGRIDAVDGEPAVLEAARRRVTAAGLDARVTVAHADLEALALPEGAYTLVWAGAVVHHLADQQAGVDRLARLLARGGRLALGEGGLGLRGLPYDLGVGRPGLEGRLVAARAAWFDAMRAAIPDGVRAPGGWPALLAKAGLVETTTRSFLFEVPPPLADAELAHLLAHFEADRRREGIRDRLDDDDLTTLDRLLDPDDSAFLGRRDDTFLLTARSVHVGRRPENAD